MLIATILSPEEQEELFTCDSCELSYSPEDYFILLKSRKLGYFRLEESGLPQTPMEGVPSACICNACIFDLLRQEAQSTNKKIKIKFVYFDKERYGVVDPIYGDDFF